MKRLCVSFVLILGILNSSANGNESGPGVSNLTPKLDMENCTIMQTFARIWKFTPLVETERAAWVVLDTNGQYRHIDWLVTPQRRISIWKGHLPENIVAQAHTHGDQLDPKPSDQDVLVARKLNISVYTLTRKGIWRAAPDGAITKEVERGWFDRTIKKCGQWDTSTPSAQFKKQ
jgi:hypothetical protein